MADKKKHARELLSRRGRERYQKANFDFDMVALLLCVVIVLATVCSIGQGYELGKPHAPGFTLWFLLFIAYLPLELLGLINWLLGFQDSSLMRLLVFEHQALGMGIFDIGLVAVVWAAVRFWAGRRYGADFVIAARHFMMMVLVWGVFQLLCLGAVTIWERGGFTPLHRHLEREAEPERVILVDQQQK